MSYRSPMDSVAAVFTAKCCEVGRYFAVSPCSGSLLGRPVLHLCLFLVLFIIFHIQIHVNIRILQIYLKFEYGHGPEYKYLLGALTQPCLRSGTPWDPRGGRVGCEHL